MIVGIDSDSSKSIQGVGTYASNLVSGLKSVAPDIKLEEFNYREFYDNMTFGQKLNKFWLRTSRGTSGDAYWEWNILPNLGKEKNIDVFHSMGGCVPRKADFKTVITVHDLAFYYYPDFLTKKTIHFFDTWYKESTQSADAVIAISEATKKDLIKFWKIPDNRIHVIHHGVSPKFYDRMPSDKIESTLKKYQIPKEYFLFVGELNYRKNLHTLLDAMQIYKKKGGKHKLVLAGKPQESDYVSGIKSQISKLGLEKDVIFTGRVSEEELFCLYQGASLFTFPSLYEGFGLPVLEAMASGTPVLAGDNSSIPEVAGGAAVLVNVQDAGAIAEGMAHAIADRENLVKKGLENARKFTWERTARETLGVYQKVLK